MRITYHNDKWKIEATKLERSRLFAAQQILEPLTHVPNPVQDTATDTKAALTTILAFLRPEAEKTT